MNLRLNYAEQKLVNFWETFRDDRVLYSFDRRDKVVAHRHQTVRCDVRDSVNSICCCFICSSRREDPSGSTDVGLDIIGTTEQTLPDLPLVSFSLNCGVKKKNKERLLDVVKLYCMK